MSKDQLAKELREKIKEGVKPSDLKKKLEPNNTPPSSPPLSPIIVPVDKSWNNKKQLEQLEPKKIHELQQEVNYWSQTAQTHLTNLQKTTAELDQAEEKIKELEAKPVQLSQEIATALKEANNKIREQEKSLNNLNTQNERIKDLEAKNQSLNKTIEKLKAQGKNTINIKSEQLFICSQCQQEWSLEFLRLVDKENKKTCAECLESMLELTREETGQEIVIETQSQPAVKYSLCQFCRQSKPMTSLKPRHIKNLPNKDPREITLLCQDCLIYRAIKADYYCPLTSEGRDTYEGNEFDCYCPANERRYQ